MKVLELFAGKNQSVASVVRNHPRVFKDFEVFTTDIEAFDGIDLVKNILDLRASDLPWQPDVIWASHPCETYSMASAGHHWSPGYVPATSEAIMGIRTMLATWHHINTLGPWVYYIENPRAILRKMPFMQHVPYRHTVSYCQYGDHRMKPTDIFTNNPFWRPRPMCKKGDPCHEAAPRGSRTGTQGIDTYQERSKVPRQLCAEILAFTPSFLIDNKRTMINLPVPDAIRNWMPEVDQLSFRLT